MKGRSKTSLRRALGLFVCIFLCAALATVPGALAQSSTHTQADVSGEPSSDSQRADNEWYSERDNATNNQSDTSAQSDEAEQPMLESDLSLPRAEGDMFTADITVGGISTPCNFQVIDAANKCVQSYARSIDDYIYPKEVVPAIDPNASGEVVIPTTVQNGNEVYTVTCVGAGSFYGCTHITSTGLAGQTSVTSFGRFSYSHCTELTDTGLADNHKIAQVAYFGFEFCSNLQSTGLATNDTATSIDDGAFNNCGKITETGLGGNEHIISVGAWTFNSCDALSETGLAGNEHVESVGIGAFEYCHNLESTGLESNDKIENLPAHVFVQCVKLTSTGLEHNSTIKTIGMTQYAAGGFGCFEQCTSLTTTGLENNSTVEQIGYRTFANCGELISTGLDENHTVWLLGTHLFENCNNLGTQQVANGAGNVTSNAGDLLLNGRGGNLTIDDNAFLNTSYKRIYVASELTNLTCAEGALDITAGHKISTLYVQDKAPWNQTDNFTFGTDSNKTTYSTSDGSLVIMKKPVASMQATRPFGSFNEAEITFSATAPFWTQIHNEAGDTLGSYEVSEAGSSPWTIRIAPSDKLSASAVSLTAQISSSEDGSTFGEEGAVFVYPSDQNPQSYNHVSQSLSGELAAVTFTLHFDAHKGVGTMGDVENVSYGSQGTLPVLGFSLEGMAFKYWSTTKEDEEGSLTRQDSDVIGDLPAKQGDTLTLYAQWQIGLHVISTLDAGDPLQGVSYELSAKEKQPIELLYGLSIDPEGHNPLVKPEETGTHWPLVSDAEGKISLYWLAEGTYYLFNTRVPAGYNTAQSPMKIEVSDKEGKAFVCVNGHEVTSYENSTAHISIAFFLTPALPTTGNLPSQLIQAGGVLIATILGIVLLRARRRHKKEKTV